MSIDALGAAVSGLRVVQRGLDVVSTNISNANTDGYTKKTLSQSTIVAGNEAMGVRYGEVQRFVDASLMRDYRTQVSVNSYYTTRQGVLQGIVNTQGSTDQESNIGARIGNLYDSFVSLSATPDNSAVQSQVVDSATALATSLNSYSDQLQNARNSVQTSIITEVDALNSSLKDIASLNKQIQLLINVGKSTATLEDQRDMDVKKVAAQLDVSYYTDGNGAMVLQTKAGQILADTEARTIETDRTTLTYSETYPSGISGLIIKGSGAQGDIDLTASNPGGKIGALLDLRDKDIPSYQAQVDELAYKMAARFDDQNVRLFTDPNGVVPVNDPAAYAGFASTIRVNPLVAANPGLLQQGTVGGSVNAGDNSNIMNVINYTFGRTKDAAGTPNTPFVTTQQGYNRDISFNIIGDPEVTLQEYGQSMLDGVAGDLNDVNGTVTTEAQYMTEVEKRVLDTSAVNTDEEMANLIELQKNYSANAKIINALDELFQDLLNAV